MVGPHRRYNPLTGEWVLVSPQRIQRPWRGQVEPSPQEARPAYDPDCYLCPGNERAGGQRNPPYTDTFVFDNDFPALLPDAPPFQMDEQGLLIARRERGICRVLCFSPRHDLTLATLSSSALLRVVETWIEQYRDLGARPFIRYVQIFENKGTMMGASNPHPHGQVWGVEHLPNEPAKELRAQRVYRRSHGSCLLCDYRDLEVRLGERVVGQNDHFLVIVPFWAIWPFETLLLSRRHVGSLADLTEEEQAGLADILQQLTRCYDALFQTPFPYSMGFHQQPTDGHPYPAWHLHAHFYPPLLRSATIRKFMVGYEMLGEPQRDLTPEEAAGRLRSVAGRRF